MLKESYPLYVANEPSTPNLDLEVTDKYSGEVATRVAMADPSTIDRAIGAAVEAARPNLEMLGRAVGGVDIADPATWPNGLVGFVWAASQQQRIR